MEGSKWKKRSTTSLPSLGQFPTLFSLFEALACSTCLAGTHALQADMYHTCSLTEKAVNRQIWPADPFNFPTSLTWICSEWEVYGSMVTPLRYHKELENPVLYNSHPSRNYKRTSELPSGEGVILGKRGPDITILSLPLVMVLFFPLSIDLVS